MMLPTVTQRLCLAAMCMYLLSLIGATLATQGGQSPPQPPPLAAPPMRAPVASPGVPSRKAALPASPRPTARPNAMHAATRDVAPAHP